MYTSRLGLSRVWKISLHESGSWSCSYVSEEKAAPFIAPGTSRHVDIWQRPPEFGEVGGTASL
jgi:hypothetical protein